jgi:hypothetical protein
MMLTTARILLRIHHSFRVLAPCKKKKKKPCCEEMNLVYQNWKDKTDKKEENKSGAELGIAPAHDTRPVAEIFLSCVRLFFSSQQLQWKIVGGGSDELLPGF